MNAVVPSPRRLTLLVLFLSAWGVAVAARVVHVAVVRGPDYRSAAAQQQERRITFQPKRGEIVDARGRELAISIEAATITADPREIERPVETARALAELLGKKPAEILDRLREAERHDRDFLYLARKVDGETAAKIRALSIRGIHLLPDSRRVHPKGALAGQVLGWVGTDDAGMGGLEHQYDREVRGRPGILTVYRDARLAGGGNVWKEVIRQEPIGGRSLRLSLDASIQYLAERELAAGLERARAASGSVVVLDPRDGAVLALASWPPWDPNGGARSGLADTRVRAIHDAYEPGSTFKIVAASAALASGALREADPVDCGNGIVEVGGIRIHEHDKKSFGIIPFSEALAVSSNVGFVRIGLSLGKEPFYRQVTAFGFGRKTGIDLPGENPGLLSEPRRWSAVSLPAMSMGQEISVTPVQLAAAFAAVANGGLLVRPAVVRDVVTEDGTPLRRVTPEPTGRVLDPAVAARLTTMLEGVVDAGTGREAAVPGYRVAGKTGTAQVAVRGGYARDRFVASFAGFVPSRDPRLVVVVVVNEPHGGAITGGKVAAPIFRRIAGPALEYLRIPPTEGLDGKLLTAQLDKVPPEPPMLRPSAPLIRTAGGDASRQEKLLGGARVVPDLSGLDARRAVTLLVAEGLDPQVTGHGRVVSQEPPAGTPVRSGSPCRLVLEPPRVAGEGTL